MSRERKHLEEKLGDSQAALEQEETKAKQEHRHRLKLEQLIAELEEKLEREIKVWPIVGGVIVLNSVIHVHVCTYTCTCVC